MGQHQTLIAANDCYRTVWYSVVMPNLSFQPQKSGAGFWCPKNEIHISKMLLQKKKIETSKALLLTQDKKHSTDSTQSSSPSNSL